MSFLENLNFSLIEILSLIGLIQCVFLLVHIVMRFNQLQKTGIAFLYFLVLGSAFFFDLAESHIGEISEYYYYLQWFAWFSGPPLSVLLIIQFARNDKLPLIREYWVLLLTPMSFVLSTLAVDGINSCDRLQPCDQLKALMTVTGLLAGAISLLVIFSKKNLFTNIRKQRQGRERYWLIFSLIFVNIMLLGIALAQLTSFVKAGDVIIVRTLLGLTFVYLVSTNMLRLYPRQTSKTLQTNNIEDFSEDERKLAQKIEELIYTQKVYQEAGYSRTDLAKECGYSETIVSKVFNTYFQKSFPQMLNELRVEEAKRLLIDTKASVATISEEVGFNSMPSFNRVFKEITGLAPSGYRKSFKT